MGAHAHTAQAGHHDHHHHEESFISKWVFSHDHKMIGKQFLVTAIVMAWVAVIGEPERIVQLLHNPENPGNARRRRVPARMTTRGAAKRNVQIAAKGGHGGAIT